MKLLFLKTAFLVVLIFSVLQLAAQSDQTGPLQAGAAKVDVTPPQSALRFPELDIIRDHIFVRAIAIDNGKTRAVIISSDPGISPNTLKSVIEKTSKSLELPAQNYLFSGTGCHSYGSGGLGGTYPTEQQITDAAIKAIETAFSKLEPAKVGFGTTSLYLNTNRDLFEGGKWYQGVNPTGSSDKTLSVLAFIGNDNKPVGVVMNYSMCVINFYLTGVLSADFPGAACSWVENRFDDRTVAIYTQGTTYDQNQRFHDLSYKLANYRTHNKPGQNEGIIGPSSWKVEASLENANAISTAQMGIPLQPEEMDGYKKTYKLLDELVTSIGAMIGESAIDVMKNYIPDYVSEAKIVTVQTEFTCPGQEKVTLSGLTPPREGVQPVFKDSDPWPIKVGLLQIGDINIPYIAGEVYSQIGLRLKAESPARKTMIITDAVGFRFAGGIPSNEAYSHLSFQMAVTRIKPGCAEDKVVSTILDLMRKPQSFTGAWTSFATCWKLTDKIYTVNSGIGARTGFVIGDKEVLVIDANTSTEGTNLALAEIAKVTSLPVSKVFLTHSDPDHVGGLAGFPKGIEVISQKQAKTEMEAAFKSPSNEPLRAYLPTTIFADNMDLAFGDEMIRLIYLGNPHTSGDAIAVFPAERLAFIGDIINTAVNPVMHPEKGSTTQGLEKALEVLLKLDVDRFVSGHSGVCTKSDINAMIKNIRDKRPRIEPMVGAGKSLAEVKVAFGIIDQPATGGFYSPPLEEIIYKELTSKK